MAIWSPRFTLTWYQQEKKIKFALQEKSIGKDAS
jgi:hypothetical protein